MPSKRFVHSVVVQQQSPSSDGVDTHFLPVNPLSVLLLHLFPLNNTSTQSNFQAALGIAGAIDKINVLFQGQSVMSMTGRDALAMSYFYHRLDLRQGSNRSTDNERRSVCVPLLFGRRAYDPMDCFPATKNGDLILELTHDIAGTGYDGLRYSVEAVELPGASPRAFERKTQMADTPSQTGLNMFELPLGNIYRGIMLFGTTGFSGAAPAPSWGRISTLVNNQEYDYSSTDWEVAHVIGGLMGGAPPSHDAHLEIANTGPQSVGRGGWENYAYLPFDVTGDDEYSIDTANASSFKVRADVETADAIRMVPVESVVL